jgi:hypothetical protein
MNAAFSKALEIGTSSPMVIIISRSNKVPCVNLVITHKFGRSQINWYEWTYKFQVLSQQVMNLR